MQSRVIFFLVMLLTLLATSPFFKIVNASPELWSQAFGWELNDEAYALVETVDGGYALAGETNSFGEKWEWHGLLVKTDSTGALEWNKTYSVRFRSLVVTSDGGFALVGGGTLMKTDSYGNVEWTQTYPVSAHTLIKTPDGGFAIGCKNHLVKTDADGNMQWSQTFERTSNFEQIFSMIQTSDGGYALAGKKIVEIVDVGARTNDFWLIKTDSYGNIEWNQTYALGAYDQADEVIETSDGGYALVGLVTTLDIQGGLLSNVCLMKTDGYGNKEWSKTYERTQIGNVEDIIQTSDEGYTIAGRSQGDFCLSKTDRNGNVEWNQTYGGPNSEVLYSCIMTSDGGYAMTGYTGSYGAGGADFWLVKTDSRGIPEFPSWAILPLLFVASFMAIFYKKKIMCRFIKS